MEITEAVQRFNKKYEPRTVAQSNQYVLLRFAEVLREVLGNTSEVGHMSEPPTHVGADIAISIGNPKLALSVVERITERHETYLDKVVAEGPFVNVWFNKEKLITETLTVVQELRDMFGTSDVCGGMKTFIEYSSPNIAKPMSVGHLRSTIIGESLARIYEATGYTVFRENYLGDWGTQFGKLIYAYQTWGDIKEVKRKPIRTLKDLYVQFHEESEQDGTLNDKARDIFKRLEGEDGTLLRLWKQFRDMSVTAFESVYKRLGIVFDNYDGESYYRDVAEETINECLKREICMYGEGNAVIAEIDNLPTFLLKKQDGATLYLSRDIAALRRRVTAFEPHGLLYVVGSEQTLHFRQLFALAKRLGYLDSVRAEHILFGLVMLGGKRMSTRKGSSVSLEELLDKSVAKAQEILLKKNSELSKREQNLLAEMVGIGSVVYSDLRQSRERTISFDWDKMLNLEGGSAVYLQYTYARARSVLRKAGNKVHVPEQVRWEESIEFQLVRKLSFFPFVVQEAQRRNAPHLICTYLEELARQFNAFYNDIPILKAEGGLRSTRLALTSAIAITIQNGLTLLNVGVPEKM